MRKIDPTESLPESQLEDLIPSLWYRKYPAQGDLWWLLTRGDGGIVDKVDYPCEAEEAADEMPIDCDVGFGFRTEEERDRMADILLRCPRQVAEEEVDRLLPRMESGEVGCIYFV